MPGGQAMRCGESRSAGVVITATLTPRPSSTGGGQLRRPSQRRQRRARCRPHVPRQHRRQRLLRFPPAFYCHRPQRRHPAKPTSIMARIRRRIEILLLQSDRNAIQCKMFPVRSQDTPPVMQFCRARRMVRFECRMMSDVSWQSLPGHWLIAQPLNLHVPNSPSHRQLHKSTADVPIIIQADRRSISSSSPSATSRRSRGSVSFSVGIMHANARS